MKTFCKVCYKQFEKTNNSQIYCSKECARELRNRRQRECASRNQGQKIKKYKGRYSGENYTNTSEKLQAIRDKYKNGVTVEHIKAMLEKEL